MPEKRRTAKELRGLPVAELSTQLQTVRKELWQYRGKAREGALQQTHLLRALRRDMARMQTILRESR